MALRTEVVFATSALRGTILTFGDIPAIPTPLFAVAAIIPLTKVPCPSRSSALLS